MKTTNMIALFGAMVVVSGITAVSTYKFMENKTVQSIADQYVLTQDPNMHNVQFMPAVSRASVTDNDFTEAAEKTVNAVVGVKNTQRVQQQQYQSVDPFFDFFFGNRGQQMPQQKAREGFGSGVIISADGYIVTNNHVIEGADQLTVTMNDDRQYDATLVGTDPTTDIALLKIDAKDLAFLPFGDSDNLKIGQWVLAVGNPFMLNSTVTAGIVSAKGRRISEGRDPYGRQRMNIEHFIQTDAAVNPGNSGGALVNTAGELVGINTAIYSQTGSYAGYSFAVPSSIASKVVADLRQYGQVQKAVLGISVNNRNKLDMDEDGKSKEVIGVEVAAVQEEGGAAEAGIKEGDIITAINKTTITNFPALQAELALHTPGEKVQVTVDRNGKSKTFTVTLKNSKGNTEMLTKKGIDSLGATFQTMTPKELQKYGVRKGVLVKSVEQGGAFARAGVHDKFVIVKINDVVVNSDKEVEAVYDKLTTARDADQEPVMFIVGLYPNGRTAYYAVDLSK